MCQRKVKIYDWSELKNIHEEIYCNNKMLSPYQSYDFLKIVGLGKNDINPFSTFGFKEKNFVLFKEKNEPVAIAPMFSKKNIKGFEVLLRGHITSAGHLDFIYKQNFTYDDYLFLMKEIKEYYKVGIIHFDRISEYSLIYKYACIEKKYRMNNSILVTIKLPEKYEIWFSNLSKSVRQNIRTSYNRLNNDKRTYNFNLYYKNTPDKKTKNDIIKLFSRRLCEHSKIDSKIFKSLLYFLKSRHPMTKGIIQNSKYIGATLYIDNELATFFDGIIGNNKRIYVPRLSINIDYGRYSPGGILINETMKKIIDMNKFTEFDLQRGDEPYKYSYGGIEYNNYSWETVF